MLDAAAPQDVLQGDGVVAQIKAPVLCFQLLDQRCIAHFQPILRLGLAKFTAVGAMAYCCPRGAEVRAIARLAAAAGIRAVCPVQLRGKIQIDVIRLLITQPRAEAIQRSGIAGEHVQAVGNPAGVAVHVGNGSRVGIRTRLVILAQRAQFRVCPILAGSQQYGGRAAHRHHRRQT